MKSSVLAILAAISALTIIGCGGGTVSVGGKITFDGKPLDGASLTFVGDAGIFGATSGADGGFSVLPNGMPAGSYKVSVIKVANAGGAVASPDPSKMKEMMQAASKGGAKDAKSAGTGEGDSAIPEKYGKAETSGLKVDVTGATSDLLLELKST